MLIVLSPKLAFFLFFSFQINVIRGSYTPKNSLPRTWQTDFVRIKNHSPVLRTVTQIQEPQLIVTKGANSNSYIGVPLRFSKKPADYFSILQVNKIKTAITENGISRDMQIISQPFRPNQRILIIVQRLRRKPCGFSKDVFFFWGIRPKKKPR